MKDKPDCRTCEHKGTDFYYGLCPQNDSEVLPQEGNRCFYYKRRNEMKTLVYVAGPYTLGDVAINVHNMIKVCDELAMNGYGVYCPLLTHFWHLISPHPYEFWIDQDNVILPKCDCLLRIPGESSGADKEIAQMEQLQKPVYFSLDILINSEPKEILK